MTVRGRAVGIAVMALLVLGMTDCKSGDSGDGDGISQVDIENYLRGNSTPPDITYRGPTQVEEGSRIKGSVCVKDPKGRPVSAVEWFMSFLHDDPSLGSHFNGTLNPEGCMSWFLDVNGLPSTLVTSDGDQVFEVEDFSG